MAAVASLIGVLPEALRSVVVAAVVGAAFAVGLLAPARGTSAVDPLEVLREGERSST